MRYRDFYQNEQIDLQANLLVQELCGSPLTENTVNEINFRKVTDKVTSVIKKFGEKVSDTNLKIYVAAANKVAETVKAAHAKAKDKNQGLMLRTLYKVVSHIASNPKLFATQLRITLSVLSLIGAAVGAYAAGEHEELLTNMFEKLGLVDKPQSFEQFHDQLQQLDQMSGDELAKSIAGDVDKLGIDIDQPQIPDDTQAHGAHSGGGEIAPSDMNDPAYGDLNDTLDQIEQVAGPDAKRKLTNLVKLERRLEELKFLGQDISANTKMHNVSVSGTAYESDSDIFMNDVKVEINGVEISHLKQVRISVERGDNPEAGYSVIDTQSSGLTSNIHKRMDDLTKNIPDELKDKFFSGARKYADWNKASDQWKESYQPRLMQLAGIQAVSEAGMMKQAAAKVAGAFQQFVDKIQKSIAAATKSVTSAVVRSPSMKKLKDGQKHQFQMVDGQVTVK